MSQKAENTSVIEYPLAKQGVNIHKNIVQLLPDECQLSQNMIWKNGMVKRGGQSLLNTTQAVASKAVVGLYRFYFGSSKQRLVAIDTKVIKDDEDNTWTDIITGQTSGLQTYFETWGALDKVYISNGTDRAQSYDGTTAISSGAPTFTLNSQPTAGQLSEVDITINGVLNTGVEGTDWDVQATTQLTSDDITSWLNGLTGISADNASGASTTITVTPAATTDVEAFVWDFKGTDTAAMATVVHLALPAKTIQTLSYQDRLLTIDDNNPGELRWTGSFTDASMELRTNTNVRPDIKIYGMIVHSLTSTDVGFRSAVLLAGANGMYLFQATDLRPPSTTGNYTIYPLATNVGCNAPRTMVWTPKGSMWLGLDKKIYLLPFNSSNPIPVSTKIESTQVQNGIESIPAAQIKNAAAIYHDGYYKIAFADTGQTTNNIQLWLDINRLNADEDGHFGPWFGPMKGQTISVFANQNGPGDQGELIGGENTAFGYIYELHNKDNLADITPAATTSNKAIEWIYKTMHNALGNPEFAKDIHKIELELLDTVATVNIDYHDIKGSIKTGDILKLTGGSLLWDSSILWDSLTWSDALPFRQKVYISPAIQPRRLSIIMKSSSSTNDFEIYAIRVKIAEQNLVFA
jgi:hypothetical protein